MSRAKRRYLAVAMAMSAAAFVGCSSDDDDGASTVPDSTASDTSGAPSTVVDADADAILQLALDDLAESGYHFVTNVTAGGSLALQAEGDHVGDGSRFAVIREDMSVEYIVTPDGTWAMPAAGEWAATDAPTAAVDPVPALDAATSVTVESSEGGTSNLVATVPDSALGYGDDRELDVTITLIDGVINELRYETTVQGLAASVLTRLGPVTDDAPVVAPI